MAEVVKTYLHLQFVNVYGKQITIKLLDPKDDLTAEQIKTAMDTINGLGILYDLNGAYREEGQVKGAKLIETTTNEFDVVGVTVES